MANLKDPLPDAVIISLDRLPSHGRAIAAWLWEAKKRRSIPLLFVDGTEEKTSITRQKFPQAIFILHSSIEPTLQDLLGG